MSKSRREKEKRKKRLEERLERQMNCIYIRTEDMESHLLSIQKVLTTCDYIVDDKGYLRANYKPTNKPVKKPKQHKKKYKKRKIGRDKKCSI